MGLPISTALFDSVTKMLQEQSHTASSDHGLAHIMPMSTLIGVFLALVALTLVTVAAAQVSFGAWEVWVSLGIASVKATLIAVYFMHLRYDKPFNAIVFSSSLLFVGLFLALTLMDLTK